ncbi:MAG: class III poly(R)-hydroxyalkanoic acid synthase subunit PhaC [Deltaproteobacteria bacterium]|jgi:polyhydroxyalkanoate synthase|nr:class III poly(R)-hydroxyalkanoic acid synthase subunit PhaC [Deltaproteobacteria bacterium]
MNYQQIIESIEKDVKEFPKKVLRASEVLTGNPDYRVAKTPADVVYSEDKLKLLHYHRRVKKKKIHKTPVLIVYALINRYIMLDLEPGRSFIQNLLNEGLDVYLIDWGYPTGADRYLDLDDYINHYVDTAVRWIRSETKSKKINLMGVCMGGTFSVIYAALHPKKVKNLITLATPTQFDIDDAGLFLWARGFDVDKAVEGLGNLPGDLANILYLLVSPVATATKYIQFLYGIENPKFVSTFLRMEKWIFDSPDMAGEFFREWIRDFMQRNLLIRNRLIIDGRKVDLRKIKCPLLNVFGKNDYLAPPSTAKPLSGAVGSKDVTTVGVDTGHVGIFVGSKSYKTISPKIAKWIRER